MKKLTLALLCCLCVISVFAQTPQLVKDINIGSASVWNSEGCVMNGKFYFNLGMAKGGGNNELWVSDGTNSGTDRIWAFKLKTEVKCLQPLGSKLFFVADDSLHGREVWVTDGTPAGTHMVKDINPAAFTSSLTYYAISKYLTAANNKIFFPADDGVHGTELWVTDGTTVGTQMVKDINLSSDGVDTLTYLYAGLLGTNKQVANKYFFAANDGPDGNELWVTDGTDASTTMLTASLSPNGVRPFNFMAFNNKLYFSDDVDTNGFYESDGIATGTKLVSRKTQPLYEDYTSMNNVLYFSGRAPHAIAIWKTDGTDAGTEIVSDSLNNPYAPWYENNLLTMSGVTALYDKIYFTKGNGLWVSDGTRGGTKNIFQSTAAITQLKVVNNKVFFKTIMNMGSGKNAEIFYTNGTDTGTKQVMYPGENFSGTSIILEANTLFSNFAAINNSVLYFSGYDAGTGIELYKLDMPTGVNTIANTKNKIEVWPNPATNCIQITANNLQPSYPTKGASCDVIITNMVGEVIFSGSFKNAEKMQVDVHAFAAGVYFIQLNGMYAGKFVKE